MQLRDVRVLTRGSLAWEVVERKRILLTRARCLDRDLALSGLWSLFGATWVAAGLCSKRRLLGFRTIQYLVRDGAWTFLYVLPD